MKRRLMPWGSMEEDEGFETGTDSDSVFAKLGELLGEAVKEGSEKAKEGAKEVGAVLVETVKEDVIVSENKGMSAHGEVDINKKEEEKAQKQMVMNQNINTLIQSEQQFEIQKLKEEAGEEVR